MSLSSCSKKGGINSKDSLGICVSAPEIRQLQRNFYRNLTSRLCRQITALNKQTNIHTLNKHGQSSSEKKTQQQHRSPATYIPVFNRYLQRLPQSYMGVMLKSRCIQWNETKSVTGLDQSWTQTYLQEVMQVLQHTYPHFIQVLQKAIENRN